MKLVPSLLVVAAVLLGACDRGAPDQGQAAISIDDLARRIERLASDQFEGRAPGSPGGEAASAWLAEEMQRAGLRPAGENGGWFQRVPLVSSRLDTQASSLTLDTPAGARALTHGEEAIFWTKRLESELSFEDAGLVFVGYGAVAPEYGWDDYAGLDARGKTVVMLVNDPGFASGDPELFTGRAMTYYGRWTYKFEEAARQGATAALIVHETEPASYGWEVVEQSWTGAQFDLVRPPGGPERAALEGWITRATAERLFSEAGLDFEEMKAAARQRGFRAVPLANVSASGRLVSDIGTMESRNVAGVLPGAERPDEYVLLTAHWDHLGMREGGEPGEDLIFNGAVDNATGVAAILEIAESLAAREEPLARSVLALAVTAEESGLLGADFFAEQPLVPLRDIAGGLNLDGMIPAGPARDIVVIGYGASELEDILARHASAAGKTLTPDPSPEAGYYYRSDHVTLARRGVPMLYADAGADLLEGGPQAGAAADADYRANRYHAPGDEYDPATWDLRGIVQDLAVFRGFAAELADSAEWPNWYEGNEFRALRDAQRADP